MSEPCETVRRQASGEAPEARLTPHALRLTRSGDAGQEQQVGVYGQAGLEIAAVFRQASDREVQVRASDHVARRADVTDHVPLVDLPAGLRVLRVSGEVAVEQQVLASGVFLVEGRPAALFLGDAHDLPVSRGENRRSARRPDVDGQMLGVLAAL